MSDPPLTSAEVFCFGRFQLVPSQRLLLCDGAARPLRGREFDLLTILVERAGEFISKDVLIAAVWPTTTVSEANLRVQVGALRRLLGDGGDGARFIVSVAGRGYCFAAPVTVAEQVGTARPPPAAAAAPREASFPHLPSRLTRMIGRRDVLEKLTIHMQTRRLITIVGAGGIGKTTLALALAEKVAPDYVHGAYFIDLTTLDESSLVAAKLVRELGLRTVAENPADSAIGYLKDKRVLLVLDNCEHLVDAVAELSEAILRHAPGVRLLATSREPLRIDGEWVHRLRSLDTPPRSGALKAAEALAYPAVELFAERAAACQDAFKLTDADAPAAAEICRRLDGVPLAVELAAARVDLFGVRSLADRLTNSLAVLKQGRRTAAARHQTLRATLDWSYELLAPRERTAFCRLAVFAQSFPLDSACAVVADEVLQEEDLIDAVFELTAKSLLDTDMNGEAARYRFLETTRSYALERFAAAADRHEVSLRHAQHCLVLLEQAKQDWGVRPHAWVLSAYGAWIDDVRAAIDWAYQNRESALLGIELTARSAPLAIRLALSAEYIGRIELALDKLARLSAPYPQLDSQLKAELASAILHTFGDGERLRQIETGLAEVPGQFEDPEARLDHIGMLYGCAFNRADWPAALEIARQAEVMSATLDKPKHRVQADRMMAQALHFLGEHRKSACYAEKVLARDQEELPASFHSQYRVNVRVGAGIALARSLWLQGLPEQAWRVVRGCLDLAAEFGGFTYCYCLAFAAVPVAVWRGDLVFAQGAVSLLGETAAQQSFPMWRQWADGLSKVLQLRADPKARLEAYWTAYDTPQMQDLQLDQFAALDARLVNARALARAESCVSWCTPEILRGAAEARRAQGAITASEAEALLLRSREIASSQGALAWELRTVISLARLWRDEDRARDGATLLTTTLARFAEGFDTTDIKAASDLLRTL